MSTPDSIQQMLRHLRDQFLVELPERLDGIEDEFLSIEKEGLTDGLYQDVFRRVHSLKGSGGTYGIHDLTAVCHQLEDVLTYLRVHGGEPSDIGPLLLAHLDLLRLVVVAAAAGREGVPDLPDRLAPLRPHPRQRYRALLVDDNRIINRICLAMMQAREMEVWVETDAYQALRPALRDAFDLILATAEGPMLNGSGLIAAVKLSSRSNQQTPCVLLTANASAHSTVGTPYGPDSVLMKDQTLPQALQEILDGLGKHAS